ncbi:MAG: hypothetical protein PHF86_08585 [Candidatus Nanoarchaeia archaeon]|nr:hypothetical protein [Candidatus Nanoarchaeia archaeon]
MNTLKKILSPLIEFDEKPKTPQSPQNLQTPTTPAFAVPRIQPAQKPPGLNAEDIEKFEKHFYKLLDDANLPGPDYFEFLQVAERLETSIPNEQMRYAATFASLCVSGLSKETLLNSAQQYITILQEDRKKFEAALQAKQQAEITSRKTRIDDLTKKIEALKAEIEQCQTSIDTLTQESSEAEQVIRKNEGAYLAACDTIIKKITTDIQKVQTSL